MFKKVDTTLGKASTLVELITIAVNKVDILPFTLAHRLNRQLGQLKDVNKTLEEARQEALDAIVGEDKMEEVRSSQKDTKINDIMTDEQMSDYFDILRKENDAEYAANLLSESFVDLIPEGSIDRDAAIALSEVVLFFEDAKVWGE